MGNKKSSPVYNYNNFSSYNVKAGGSKNSPEGFSMRSGNNPSLSELSGVSPIHNEGPFGTSRKKEVLSEWKSQQKDFLSSKDLTANQDTVRQSNIDYFKKYQFGPKANDGTGNVSTHYINKIKKSQVNKNIDLSSTPGAGSRSSERIQKNRYATSEHGSKKNLNKKIKNLSSDIKAKDSLKKFLSKNPPPQTNQTNKGKIKQGYAPISFPLGRKI